MYKKKLIQLSIITIFSVNSLFAIGGAGLHFISDQVLVKSVTDGHFTRDSFENPGGIGGYLYLNAIPIVELDFEFQVAAEEYAVSYLDQSLGDFKWGRASFYFTAKKKVFGAGIPFLAKAKIHVGAGFNSHSYTPYASEKMLGDLLSGIGDVLPGHEDELAEGLVDFLVDNKESSTGFHIQTGIQFKLLMLDTHLFYRYNLTKDVYTGSDGFGSFNIRLGMAI